MNTIILYIRESLEELHQVRWPTQQQAIRLTVIVTLFIIANAAFFGAIDAALVQMFRFTLRV